MHQRSSMRMRGIRAAFPLLAAAVFVVGAIGCTEPEESVVPEATSVGEQPLEAAGPASEPRTYVVERGDTLARIARAEGVPLGDLVELNELTDPDVIEVGDVLLLEATPGVPQPNIERSIVSREPADRSLGARLSDWWDGLYRPDLNLSDRSLSQGAVAGLMLPAAVLAFVALWIVWSLLRRTQPAFAAAGGWVFGRSRGDSDGDETAAERDPRSPWTAVKDLGIAFTAAVSSAASRLRPRRSEDRLPAPRVTRSVGNDTRFAGAIGMRISALATALLNGARYLARSFGTVLQSLRSRVQGRLQERREDRGRHEAEELWVRGSELMRIGLTDEARRCFEDGLRLARSHGWDEEAQRHLAALDDIAARRQEQLSR